MSWLTVNDFKDLYLTESATEIKESQINQSLDSAIDKLAEICGEDIVGEIESADDALRKTKSFRRAQGKFAYAEILFLMSSRFRSGGILIKESDSNAGATDEYANFSDVEKRRQVLIAEALDTIKTYIAPGEQPIEQEFYLPPNMTVNAA